MLEMAWSVTLAGLISAERRSRRPRQRDHNRGETDPFQPFLGQMICF
jgi:hypothetical protein